jgi:tetratricopeptide (TPR) repeat protein
MAIRSKSLDDMIREIIISLRTGEPKRPAFTLLVGSGFSYPIIPTPTQMLKGDIAWWRYSKDQRFTDPFCSRAEGVAGKKATEEQIAEFEREMWKPIHARALTSKETAFGLTADGLPDLTTPNAVGLAYQAVMTDGLLNNKMRRQYLRDAIQRSHPKVNGAHIFLAGILEAQETWDWGAPFCRTIFTTNFDPLLQRSLQLVNKLYYMTDRPDVLEPPDDDQSEAIHLVYTHGSVHRYDLLNTEDQIKHARERNAPTLIEYFRHHGVIVIGYSGWADTTMEALSSCPSFDSNLYWCGTHPEKEAESRLRPEVVKILHAREKNAFYIEIKSADDAMRLLHRELKLGDVPKFILAPVETMIVQLKSIDVPSEPTASAKSEATTLSTSLATLLDGTLRRLDVAKSAFDNPSIVQPPSAEGKEDVERALIAQLMSDAFVAYSQGKRERAIALWSILIDKAGVPPKDRALALRNRGIASREGGQTTNAIDDFTAVIDMLDAPADQKMLALHNRGVALGKSGETTEEIADYTTVIDMPDASADWKAKALNYRGITWGQIGEITKEIADYTAVIDMPGAPADQKAQALCDRGIALGKSGETTQEIADYTTVIDMPDAPSDLKAKALNYRGITWGQIGEITKEIADYTAVIDMPGAPAAQKVHALYNRGVTLGKSGETTKAITDFTAIIDMPDAPSEHKVKAFWGRGWRRFVDLDDAQSMIEDSRKALEFTNDNLGVRANLALGLLLTGETDAALSQYEALLSRSSDTSVIRVAIGDLETALQKRPDTPEAAKVLDRLRSAMAAKNDGAAAAPS